MSPFERAAEVYRTEWCRRTLREDLEAHLVGGFVFARPDFFIMGRPVVRTADPALVVDPWHHFPTADCDCWHVYLFAGNMARAWSVMPWPLPWFSWERKNELRFGQSEVVLRLSGGALPSPASSP